MNKIPVITPTLEKVIFIVLLILFALVSLVPFNFLKHIKIFRFPFYYLLIGGPVLLLMLLTWVNDNLRIREYDRWLLFLCFGFLLSLISSVDRLWTLRTAGSFVLRGLGVAFVACRVMNSQKRKEILEITLISIVSVVCLIGLIEFFLGKTPIFHNFYLAYNKYYYDKIFFPSYRSGIASTIGYSTPLGVYLVLFLPLSLLFGKQKKYIWSYVPFILIVLIITLSFTRSAFFAGLVCLIWYFLSGKSNKLDIKILFTIPILIFIIGILLTLNPQARTIFSGRFNPKKISESHRIASFRTTLNILKEKPLLGVGLGNYPKVHHIYRNGRTAPDIKTLDNLYLTMLCETGVIGTLIFLIFMFQSVRYLWLGYVLSGDMTILVILIGIVGFLICSIAGEFFGWLTPQFAFWLLLGAGIGLSRKTSFIGIRYCRA